MTSMPKKGVVVDFPNIFGASKRAMPRADMHPLVGPPASTPTTGSNLVVAGRPARGAGQLLSDRLHGWARAMPPWRVAQGFLLADVADALAVPGRRLRGVMDGTGWWAKPGPGDAWLWLPPWVSDRHGEALHRDD
jgi:hypothetical protein